MFFPGAPPYVPYSTEHSVDVIFEVKQIAPNADIYVSYCSMFYFEKLISAGVNIINCSSSIGVTQDATNKYTEFVDALVYQYGITVVCAAANVSNDIGRNDISTYAAGYNVIAVGNVNYNLALESSSCYSLNSNTKMAYRPDLCAIGLTNYLCPIGSQMSGTGTSFSSPRVAGSIALLMEYSVDLMFSPPLSKAVITASTKLAPANFSLTNDTEKAGYEKFGAGILDCSRAYNILKKKTYRDIYAESPGTKVYSASVKLEAGQTIRLAVADSIPCSYVRNENSSTYTMTYGILPNITVFLGRTESVTINEKTTSLHVVEFTATKSMTCTIRINSSTPINDGLDCSFAFIID